MDGSMNGRTRGYSHSHFSHHTFRAGVAMIRPRHHCHLTNRICHLLLAVKQTAAKPEVSDQTDFFFLGRNSINKQFFISHFKIQNQSHMPCSIFYYKSVSGLTMANKNTHFNGILEFLTSWKTILELILILQQTCSLHLHDTAMDVQEGDLSRAECVPSHRSTTTLEVCQLIWKRTRYDILLINSGQITLLVAKVTANQQSASSTFIPVWPCSLGAAVHSQWN